MKTCKTYIKNFARVVFQPAHSLNLKNITGKNLPYFIGWICIFIWLYSYFLPMGGFRFESSLYNRNAGNTSAYYFVWLFSGCLIPVLFDGKQFLPKTFYSVVAALACFLLIRFTGESVLSQGLMLAASVCIGHIFASNVYAFFMVLNNSEKFFSMVLAVLAPKVLMLVKLEFRDTGLAADFPSLLILAVILVLAVCSFFFLYHTESIPLSAGIKPPAGAYALMPLVFVVLAINDVIAPATMNSIRGLSKSQMETYYFFGVLAGLAAVLFWQRRFSVNICNMLNLSFALLTIGFVLNISSFQNSADGTMASVCFGASYAIGFVNIYYLAGFMTKKFQSVVFYRVGIVLSALYYLAAFLVLEGWKQNEALSPTLMATVCICIVIVFFIFTPFFIKMLYAGEWIEDAYRLDVTRCSRLEAKLRDYKLTAAEIEVCRLLLEGCTLRQISAVQSKAYATINTYCTSIYRKMNINSRTELILLLQDYLGK